MGGPARAVAPLVQCDARLRLSRPIGSAIAMAGSARTIAAGMAADRDRHNHHAGTSTVASVIVRGLRDCPGPTCLSEIANDWTQAWPRLFCRPGHLSHRLCVCDGASPPLPSQASRTNLSSAPQRTWPDPAGMAAAINNIRVAVRVCLHNHPRTAVEWARTRNGRLSLPGRLGARLNRTGPASHGSPPPDESARPTSTGRASHAARPSRAGRGVCRIREEGGSEGP